MSIDCPVRKNPLKHAKSLTVTRKIEIYHFFDYESDEPLDCMGGYREDIEGLRINCIGINIHVEINGGRDLWIT